MPRFQLPPNLWSSLPRRTQLLRSRSLSLSSRLSLRRSLTLLPTLLSWSPPPMHRKMFPLRRNLLLTCRPRPSRNPLRTLRRNLWSRQWWNSQQGPRLSSQLSWSLRLSNQRRPKPAPSLTPYPHPMPKQVLLST